MLRHVLEDVETGGITIDCVAPQATGGVQMHVKGVTVRTEGPRPYTMVGDLSGAAPAWRSPSGTVVVGCIMLKSVSASISGQFTCSTTSPPTSTSSPTLIPSLVSNPTATAFPTKSPLSNSIPFMAIRAAGDNTSAKRIKLSSGFSVCPIEISAHGITLERIAPDSIGKVEM